MWLGSHWAYFDCTFCFHDWRLQRLWISLQVLDENANKITQLEYYAIVAISELDLQQCARKCLNGMLKVFSRCCPFGCTQLLWHRSMLDKPPLYILLQSLTALSGNACLVTRQHHMNCEGSYRLMAQLSSLACLAGSSLYLRSARKGCDRLRLLIL